MLLHKSFQFHPGQLLGEGEGRRYLCKSIASPEDARSNAASRFVTLERDKDPWRDGSTLPIATTRDTYKKDIASSVGAPAWDVMEHKVLRFFAYFNEHVDESRLENYRSRPVEILYYLEDDTMAVVEPKIDNSGMRSGTLIKRHRFPRADETEKLVSPADLRVGTTFIAYGKTFALTACDAFTREWYRKSGMSQPSDYSSDFPGSVHPNQLKDSKGDASLYVSVKPTTDDFHKRIDSPEPVCRFYAYFDDNFTNKLERRMYTILYFPRNSTLELRENLQARGGTRFTVFISRRKVLKGIRASVGPSEPLPPETAYFTLQDFKVGSVVTIADRDFFIYAADSFTTSFVKETLGIQLQEPINIETDKLLPPPPNCAIRRTHARPNLLQINNERKPPLSFRAISEQSICICGSGQVVHILFFPEDNSVSVFQPKVEWQNSTAGEKLHQRSVYFNEDAGRPFQANDFVVGSVVTINGQRFKIMGTIEFPGGHHDGEPDQERVLLHLRRLWEGLRGNEIKTSDMFSSCDEQRKGFLTYQDFQKGMERFGYTITEQDALAIARYFDSTKDGKVDFEEFCKGMLELQGPFLANSQRLSDALHSDIKGYGETAKVEFTKLEDIRAIKRSFKLLQARLYQQPRMLQLLTKEFARSSLGRKVPLSEAVQVFDRCGFEQSHEEIRSIVQELLPGTEGDEIDYIDLISALKSTCRGV